MLCRTSSAVVVGTARGRVAQLHGRHDVQQRAAYLPSASTRQAGAVQRVSWAATSVPLRMPAGSGGLAVMTEEARVDPVTVVISALAAGAARGVKDSATTAVKNVYTGLQSLLVERFRGKPDAEVALRGHEVDPQAWEAMLVDHVQQVGVDEQMLRLAQWLLDEIASPAPTNTIHADRIQGFQQGNQNTQTNTFS